MKRKKIQMPIPVQEKDKAPIGTEEAVMSTFIQFCDQYAQMGETLKVLGSFISTWKREQDDRRG